MAAVMKKPLSAAEVAEAARGQMQVMQSLRRRPALVLGGGLGPGGLRCTFCCNDYPSWSHLVKHLRIHTDSPYPCLVCQVTFKKRLQLEKHLVTHTEAKCQRTVSLHREKGFPRRLDLGPARPGHSRKKRIQCPTCGEGFYHLEALTKHFSVHTGKKTYGCPDCDRSFWSIRMLDQHLLSHAETKAHQCPHCVASFSAPSDLQRHRLSHDSEKVSMFRCTECGMTFPRAGDLYAHHNAQHPELGDNPFRCLECHKSFPTAGRLSLHQMWHARWTPCPQCGKHFKRLCELEEHQRTHAGEGPFQCPLCDERYKFADVLDGHLRFDCGRPATKAQVQVTVTSDSSASREPASITSPSDSEEDLYTSVTSAAPAKHNGHLTPSFEHVFVKYED